MSTPAYPAAYVTAKVPEFVIGDPATLRPVGTVMDTEVTDPLPVPKPRVEVATHRVEVPVESRTLPLFPSEFVTSKSEPSNV